MAERYKLLFHGETVQGQDSETVKRNLGTLFRIDEEKINRLFATLPVIIKKDIDRVTAEQFRSVLEKAGVLCSIEPMGQVQQAAPPPERSVGPGFQYEVVFYGECIEGFSLPAVKQGLAGLYKTDVAKIDELLSRLPVAVKRNVNLEIASHYQIMMRQIGANCLIRPIPPPQGQAGGGQNQTEKGAASPSPPSPAEARRAIQPGQAAAAIPPCNGTRVTHPEPPAGQSDGHLPSSTAASGHVMPASLMAHKAGQGLSLPCKVLIGFGVVCCIIVVFLGLTAFAFLFG